MVDTFISWVVEPKFRVVHDGLYNRFSCVEAGRISLGGELIDFDFGWTTDFTTGNWFTFIFVPQLGPHVPAALIHDLLLDLGRPRAEARKWMRTQLRLLENVPWWRRILMPLGIRVYDLVKHGV